MQTLIQPTHMMNPPEASEVFNRSPFFPQYLHDQLVGWRFSLLSTGAPLDTIIDEMVLQPLRMQNGESEFWLWDPWAEVPEHANVRKIRIPVRWDLEEFFSFLSTWTPVLQAYSSIGDGFFERAVQACRQRWGAPDQRRLIQFELYAVLAA